MRRNIFSSNMHVYRLASGVNVLQERISYHLLHGYFVDKYIYAQMKLVEKYTGCAVIDCNWETLADLFLSAR